MDRRTERIRQAQTRDLNRRAAVTMAQVMGGMRGIHQLGLGLRDLAPIMEADPNDDLSGLRLLAERMNPVIWHEQPSPTEPNMEPAVAEHWLLASGRVKNHEGILILTDKDHVSKAGFRIATGMGGQKLSAIYKEVSDSTVQITPMALASITETAISSYREQLLKQN